jgi:hypothetical protein
MSGSASWVNAGLHSTATVKKTIKCFMHLSPMLLDAKSA